MIVVASAVITGASSGLGKEYFNLAANNFEDIDEIWIISRSKEKLDALAQSIDNEKKRVIAVYLDLSKDESYEKLGRIFEMHKPDIRLLINNAGAGNLKSFENLTEKEAADTVKLNALGLTMMTKVCLPYMGEDSFILNVSSIGSFAPTANMSVYCATKAYVSSFSMAIAEELEEKGITVTAVCPGPMETNFFNAGNIKEGSSKKFFSLPRENPEKIAEKSMKAMMKGKRMYIGKFYYKLYRFLSKILPNDLAISLSKL